MNIESSKALNSSPRSVQFDDKALKHSQNSASLDPDSRASLDLKLRPPGTKEFIHKVNDDDLLKGQ